MKTAETRLLQRGVNRSSNPQRTATQRGRGTHCELLPATCAESPQGSVSSAACPSTCLDTAARTARRHAPLLRSKVA